MSHSCSYFSHQNGSFLFSHKDLTTYQIKAPVRWGVNATLFPFFRVLGRIKAPVRWGINFKTPTHPHIKTARRGRPGGL